MWNKKKKKLYKTYFRVEEKYVIKLFHSRENVLNTVAYQLWRHSWFSCLLGYCNVIFITPLFSLQSVFVSDL